MWNCPKCNTQNWDDARHCHKCKSDRSGQLQLNQHLLLDRPSRYAFYTLNFGPGEVRYVTTDCFAAVEIENWIEFFKQYSKKPQIEGPWAGNPNGLDRVDVKMLFGATTWEEDIRIHHGFAVLHRDFLVPSVVYTTFHSFLMLRSFEVVECVDSWVREAWDDPFLLQTFLGSAEHVVKTCGENAEDLGKERFAVFKKTPFVASRMDELQKLEVETNAMENIQRLRRSSFTTFVYIMEDLRNGLFKIGQSQTPEKREHTLQSEVPETSLRFYIPNHDSAERELHELFAAKRIRGEWFGLEPEDLLSIIGILKADGDLERATIDYEWLGKISFAAFPRRQIAPRQS